MVDRSRLRLPRRWMRKWSGRVDSNHRPPGPEPWDYDFSITYRRSQLLLGFTQCNELSKASTPRGFGSRATVRNASMQGVGTVLGTLETGIRTVTRCRVV